MTTPTKESKVRAFSENANVESRYRGVQTTVAGYMLATLAIVSVPTALAVGGTTTTGVRSVTQNEGVVSTEGPRKTSTRAETAIRDGRSQEAASLYEQSARSWQARAETLRTHPMTPINGRPGLARNRQRDVQIRSAERKARRMRSKAAEARTQARIHGSRASAPAVTDD